MPNVAAYGAVVSLAFPFVVYCVRVIDVALLGNFNLLGVTLVFAAAYSSVLDAPPAPTSSGAASADP